MKPMKPRRPGGPHDALAQAMTEIGLAEGQGADAGVPIAAAFEGVSVFTLYKQLDPDNATTEFSWPRLWRLVDRYKCRAPVEALASLIGCRLVDMPKARAAEALVPALLHMVREGTEAAAAGFAAAEDGVITVKEARHLRGELGEALQAILELDARLEQIEKGGGR